jgi:hypothetical protein
MRGAIPLLPQYAFMAWYSVKKRRDNFTLYMYMCVCAVKPMGDTTAAKEGERHIHFKIAGTHSGSFDSITLDKTVTKETDTIPVVYP